MVTFGSGFNHIFIQILPTQWHVLVLAVTSRFPCSFCRSFPKPSMFCKKTYFVVEKNEWTNGKDDHFVVVAEYDFQAQGDDELSFRQGQTITVAPKGKQAYLTCLCLHSVYM